MELESALLETSESVLELTRFQKSALGNVDSREQVVISVGDRVLVYEGERKETNISEVELEGRERVFIGDQLEH